MTNDTNKPGDHANHGNETTVYSPKAPGNVGKVNPTTGDTSTESVKPGTEKPDAR